MYTPEFKNILTTTLNGLREEGLYKEERFIASQQYSQVTLKDGRSVINMCANNYLGLANNPEVMEAAKKAIDQWGFGMASVRFICGTQTLHRQLEERLSEFLGTEDTILFPSCFDANGGLFEGLLTADDAIISDSLNHASIIDEEAAPVVKQIYQLCLAGNGPTKIARMLTEQEIPTPGTLEYQRTGSIRRYHPGYECKWATNTVVHLLENREYTGCLVNFKTEKPSYKMKHSIDNPIEKQAIFENHHEPIIDLQTWERVQELRKQRKRPNRYDDVGLFSGLLFCADCGHVMYQQRYQTDKRKQDCYICGSYKKRTADCTAHFIRTDLLTAGVLDNLRKVTAYAQKHEARFVKLLIQQNEMGGKRKQAAATKQLEQVQSRIAELSRYIKRLYEDNVNGKINDERFMEMSADYEAEQRELKEKAAALQGELDKAQEATVNAEKFMNVVRKYLSIEELTHTLLREMVEKIVVYECEYDENEVRHQRIDIYYSFVGKIDLPEE